LPMRQPNAAAEESPNRTPVHRLLRVLVTSTDSKVRERKFLD